MNSITLLQHAKLEWLEDGTPSSANFKDIYFSKAGGLAETEYVFLQANELPRRMQTAAKFTIAETGFGTGLNFLAAWRLWSQVAPADAKLRFISVEHAPLTRADLERALNNWPELKPFAERLLTVYPEPFCGWHTLKFEPEGVTLRLFFGDVHDAYADCKEDVNAWFLDGFAPAKNPEMWQTEVMEHVGRMCVPGGTFSTFTAAAAVRQQLEEQGFEVRKTKGFGRKRDMLMGIKK